MDPRRVLLEMDLEDLGGLGRSKRRDRVGRSVGRSGEDGEHDLLDQVKCLRRTVEEDHDARLRGIEINIRWLMVLVGGEVLAIVGFALSSVAGV